MSGSLQSGQRVEVDWGRHGWLPGTFDGYRSGDLGEDFQRCDVVLDNGWACKPPGFHPDCVRPAQDDSVILKAVRAA